MTRPNGTNTTGPRVLAVASGGGHWVQMLRLIPAFDGAKVHFATTDSTAAVIISPAPLHVFPDANKDRPLRLAGLALRMAAIFLRVRPDVVISTGAAGGLVAIAMGRLCGARCLFIDSIANAETLSLSARLARHIAHRTFSQWPGVARHHGAEYHGAVI
ncbi:MAG: hypothetical protein RIT14_138 [Pseudomonadota bacterium]|jgi:UDP-N-acetylglucosamine:LPS N-acetylglucosamine transferase